MKKTQNAFKLFILGTCTIFTGSLSAQSFSALDFDFSESAFTSVNGTISGTTGYNLIDDVTGVKLGSNNGDLDDVFITVTSSLPASASGAEASVEIASAGIRSRHAYTNSFQNTYASGIANNPGSLIEQTIRISFASHLSITDFTADFSSLNTAGITWEYTEIALLQADGSYFSAPPVVGGYATWQANTAFAEEGSTSTGWWVGASTGTVNGVGSNQTSSGSSGADQAFTTTNGDSIFAYNDVGIADGTQVGGLEWTVYLEDVRGQDNGASNLTATLTDFSLSGVVIPEPSSTLLIGLGGMFLLLRKRK